MAKDPAFLFYPGDYLRDTQCLSEPAQVAYDRIMCEHMRNICISQQQLDFFTKRLTSEQKEELLMVLARVDGGFQIVWVADSILKRRNYSEGRRKNRIGKRKKKDHINNTSSSYDHHMENENVIENENENVKNNKKEPENLNVDLDEVYNEITRETLHMTFRDVDVDSEWDAFKVKVRGSPETYAHRDVGSLRLAFNHQLRNAKKKTGTGNGKIFNKNNRDEFNQNELEIIRQHTAGSQQRQAGP